MGGGPSSPLSVFLFFSKKGGEKDGRASRRSDWKDNGERSEQDRAERVSTKQDENREEGEWRRKLNASREERQWKRRSETGR